MAQGTTIFALLKISVLGTIRIYVVLLAGFLASKWPRNEPLLTREACRYISRVCAQLFLPALVISSTGGTLNPAALRDAWPLLVSGGFTTALSAVIARFIGRVLLGPDDHRAFRPVQLAIAFPNALTFPLLLMASVCEQDDINRDFGGDSAECFTRATGMLFVYNVVWQICFYGWGFYAIGDERALELKLTGHLAIPPDSIEDLRIPSSDTPDNKAHAYCTPSQGNTQLTTGNDVVAVDIKLEHPSIPLLSTHVSHRVAYGANNAHCDEDDKHPESVHQPGIGVTGEPPYSKADTGVCPARTTTKGETSTVLKHFTKIGGCSPSGRKTTARVSSDAVEDCLGDSYWAKIGQRGLVIATSPNILSVMVGVFIVMVHPLQQLLYDNPDAILRPLGAAFETVGTPMVAASTLVMAGSLAQASTGEATGGLERGIGGVKWNMRRFRFIAGALHIMCRLILVPAVGFALFWLTTTYSTVLGENRLMYLIILIQLAMPSAALIIVTLNQLEMPATAGFMARLYIWQYGISMFTIAFWTALAVHMVY